MVNVDPLNVYYPAIQILPGIVKSLYHIRPCSWGQRKFDGNISYLEPLKGKNDPVVQ